MKITKDNFNQLLPSLHLASSGLNGSRRRRFLGQLALDLGFCGRKMVSKHFSISRDTLRKGIGEIKSGIIQVDNFSARGRRPLEETNPELLAAIKEIVDSANQTDSQFKSTRLYTYLSVNQIKKQLISRGYKECDLPVNQTIWNKLCALGYKRKKAAKTKPKKNNRD